MAGWPRITITLSDRARELVDYVRDSQDSSASETINYLLLKDEPRKPMLREEDGLLVLSIEDEGLSITLEDIQIIEDEEYVYPRETQKPTPRRTSIALSPEAIEVANRCQVLHGISRTAAINRLLEKLD